MAGPRPAWLTTLLAALVALAGLVGCGDHPGSPTPITNTWTLTVTVVDPQQRPIASATVRVLDGANAGRVAVSDASGVAAFGNLQQSGFSIEVSAPAYQTSTTSVTLTAAVSLTVSLRLAVNAPPVVSALVAKGSRANEPAGFADLGEAVAVTATVTDSETPVAQLVFEWTANSGSIQGSGPSVVWRAPAAAPTPLDVVIGVAVIERWTAADGARENRTAAETKVGLHDSAREIAAMAEQFIHEFSIPSIAPETVVRDFAQPGPSCPSGRASELNDVRNNRADLTIQDYHLGQARVTVNFGGVCAYRAKPGDGCADIDVQWKSLVKSTGAIEYAWGDDQVTAVYVSPRWWLCESDFKGQTAPNPPG